MAGFVQNLLKDVAKGFFGNDYLRDYTHASKTFRTNSYQYAPKLKFLFHVYFDINQNVYSEGLGTGANFGLAVKKVGLPSYTFNTTELNQYNRKRIIQTKVKYDPITINFHDDNGNLIRNLWYYYFTYYYKDANKPVITPAGRQAPNNGNNQGSSDYNSRNIYQPSIMGNDDWGYIGEGAGGSNSASQSGLGLSKTPFFKNITIYGFNQHNFVSYVLINPIITRFSHDTYDYSANEGTMENTMTIDYETVKYFEGAIDGKDPGNMIPGFAENATYDRRPSPIMRPGANATILGKGGLVDAAGGIINDLSNQNYLGAIQTAGTAYNTFKNINLKQTIRAEVNSEIVNSVQQTPNRNNLFQFPVSNQTPNFSGQAGGRSPGIATPPYIPTGGRPNSAGNEI